MKKSIIRASGIFFASATVVVLAGCNSPMQARTPASLGSNSPAAHSLSSSVPTPANSVFNVKTYGALGNGTRDDTQAILAALNAAQASGGILFFPVGQYIISAQLSISNSVTVQGVGYTTNSINTSSGYIPPISAASLQNCSCIIQTNPAVNTFAAVTTSAVQFMDFAILYPKSATAYSGVTGISVNGGSGVGNTQSLVRNVLIEGADRGISFESSASWVVDNVVVYDSQTYGLIQDSSLTGSAASAGDWQVSSSFFASASASNYANIYLAGGGGGRFYGNRLNSNGGYGILIGPSHYVSGGFNIEPVVITSNNIEGAEFGIAFIGAPGNDGHSTLGVITANSIWADTDIYSVAGPVYPAWVEGWSIYGNVLNSTAGAGWANINMNGTSGINITGNAFYIGSGATPTTFGNTSSTVNVAGNSVISGNSTAPAFAAHGAVGSAGANGPGSSASTFNVKTYGALGNGTTDDTKAIQAAINAAQTSAGTVFFPAGNYIISATLPISKAITVQGIGYQSAGTNFITTNGAVSPIAQSSLRNCSCIIQTNPGLTIFSVSTTSQVQFMELELFYPNFATPYSGATGIAINGGSSTSNTQSYLHDLFIYGADRGVTFSNASGWTVDNVLFYNSQTYGLMEDATPGNPAYQGNGWAIINSTFETGTGTNYSHILISGGGSGSIIANKLNAAGNGTQAIMNGIAIAPTHYATGGYKLGPFSITDNRIEGEKVGISFYGAPGNDGLASAGTIIGNQIWANIDIYSVAGPVYPVWVSDWTISGNVLNSEGGANTYNVLVDGATNLAIVGNTLTTVMGSTTPDSFGPNTSAITYNVNLVDY